MNDPDVIDPNLDKTSKSNVIRTRLKDGEETRSKTWNNKLCCETNR